MQFATQACISFLFLRRLNSSFRIKGRSSSSSSRRWQRRRQGCSERCFGKGRLGYRLPCGHSFVIERTIIAAEGSSPTTTSSFFYGTEISNGSTSLCKWSRTVDSPGEYEWRSVMCAIRYCEKDLLASLSVEMRKQVYKRRDEKDIVMNKYY